MRVSLLVLLAFFTALLAGCGGYQPGEDAVVVRIQEEYDQSGGLYFEGSYSYVRVERLDGEKLLQERLDDRLTARLRLDPGTYRIASLQRPCEGNCGSLDPPTDERAGDSCRASNGCAILAGAGVPCRLVPRRNAAAVVSAATLLGKGPEAFAADAESSDFRQPPILLASVAGRQRAVQETYCIAVPAEEGGVVLCADKPPRGRARWLSVVRPKEHVTIRVRGR